MSRPNSLSSCASPGPFDRQRRIDQPDMGKGLRKISQRRAGVGIDLFREKADIVCEGAGVIEQFLCPADLASLGQKVDPPKAANPECPFGRRVSVVTGFIPVQETVACETLQHEVQRTGDARIVWFAVTDNARQQ